MSDTQVEQTNEETQGQLGLILKERREQSGHNIYEVAEALCLSPETVTALEEEDYDTLPEPPYIRGYLRSYAKFAEIDSEEIIELYEKQRGADPKDLEYHFKPSNNGNLSKPAISPNIIRLGLFSLLLVALASISMIPTVNNWISETWAGFSAQTAQKNYTDSKGDTESITYEVPAPLPGDTIEKLASADTASSSETTETIDKQTSETTGETDNKDATKNKEKATTEDNKKTDDKESISETSTDETKKEDEKAVVAEGDTKLKFVFKSEVWMRIKDKKNKTVFESLSPAGEEKEIKLNKPMTFRIGNAAGVEIFVEGKPLDIKGFTKGSVANFTIE